MSQEDLLYQNIEIDGKEISSIDPRRKKSRFWNEGKWDNFIAPLLPKDCKDLTLIEIGCNVGLYLKMAKDKGFKHVLGIEMDKKACEWGEKYRDSLGYDYKILNIEVGKDFSFNELPLADVVLLSNVHYHFPIDVWIRFLDQMLYRTCYCIIISRPFRVHKSIRPRAEIADIRHYFQNWQSCGAVYGKRAHGDPVARDLWSFLFQGKLKRIKIDDLIIGATGDNERLPKEEFVREVLRDKEGRLQIEKTGYYKRLESNLLESWGKEKLIRFVEKKACMVDDIKRHGQKEPIIIELDGKIIDGHHRVTILKELGYKSVIARVL